MRRRFDGHRRIAPGQRQQLVLVEVEAIRFFKRWQRVRALNKFRRSRQLKFAALLQVATEVGQRGQLIFLRQVLAHGDSPGVVGRRRGEPYQLMFLLIEALHLLIALLGILPRRVVFIFEEEGAIAGIFRVDIQLAGDNRPAHHRRGAELDFINRFYAVAFQHLLDHIAQQRAFGINFRADLHRLRRLQR
ncbi:Uncharacterised protein [Klebsiella pneumoniae]|nr:Uncharacterised protein [Klebsiella pneumoniae]